MDQLTKEMIGSAVGYSYVQVDRTAALEDGVVITGGMVVCRFLIPDDGQGEFGIVVSENGAISHYSRPTSKFCTEGLKEAIEFGLRMEGRRSEIQKVAARADWAKFRETRVVAETMLAALKVGMLKLAEEKAKELCVLQVDLHKYAAMRKG